MKKIISGLVISLFLFVFVIPVGAKVERVNSNWSNWTIEGQHAIVFTCGGGSYAHTLTNGFPGSGTYDPDPNYTWNMTGDITGDNITFNIFYTGTNAGYTLNGVGTIDSDGSISGTTDGNCQTFDMPEETATRTRFEGNHGQYVSNKENKKEAAQSRVGMPVQSNGHNK